MNSQFSLNAKEIAESTTSLTNEQIYSLLLQSLLLGTLLLLITAGLNYVISKYNLLPKEKDEKPLALNILVVSSANMLYLCVCLTGLMILVDNNLARAFAIAAAVALIRFKGKIAGKSSDTTLIFAVLTGMAMGVGQIQIAWIIVGFYLLIQCVLLLFLYLYQKYFNKV